VTKFKEEFMRYFTTFFSVFLASVALQAELKGAAQDSGHSFDKLAPEAKSLQGESSVLEVEMITEETISTRPPRRRVYCDYYEDSNTWGYSLYRYRDYKDIANAVFKERWECDEAARVANLANNGIVCAKYHNSSSGRTNYSVYRIRDNKDLGNSVITDFTECQYAIEYSARGIFCSTYSRGSQRGWSPYSVRSGDDLGTKIYSSVYSCVDSLY
jgi:hypothetical protein